MADQLPTWDEALATAHLPTFDQALREKEMLDQYSRTLTGVGTGGAEAYGGVNSGEPADAFFSSGPAANILNAFGQGAAHEWGAIASGGLSPETTAALRKGGWFNDYETNRLAVHKTFNEAMFRIFAPVYHGFNALMGGTHEALLAAAKEGGPVAGAPFAAAVGAMEAFPVGHGTGLPARLPRALVEANDLKIIGYGEPGWKGLPSPTQVAIDALRPAQELDRPATRLEFTPEEEPPTGDRNARAREVAPDTFREYDELTQQRETFRQHLEELRGGSEVRDLDEQIDALRAQNLEVPPGAERRALNNRVTELEGRREVLADRLASGSDTPQMAMVRRALQETDYRMRDLSPDVSAAYRTAAGETGAPAVAAEVAGTPAAPPPPPPPLADDPLAMQRRGELTAARAAEIRDELGRAPPGEGAAEHLDPKIWKVIADNLAKAEASREGGISVVADQMRYLPDDGVPKTISEREAVAVIARALDAEAARGGDAGSFLAEADGAYRAAGGGTPPDVTAAEAVRVATPEPAPVVPNIAQDRSRQLVAAGYPKEVADAAAALEQAHYETVATVYGGAKGTAEEIYAAMAPEARARRGARALELAQRRARELGQSAVPGDSGLLNPLEVPADAAAKVARKVARTDKSVGSPVNEKSVLLPNGVHIGPVTFRQWVNRVTKILSPDEIAAAANWYKAALPAYERYFGKEKAPEMLGAWLIANQNATPGFAQLSAVRAIEQYINRTTGSPVAGLASKKLYQWWDAILSGNKARMAELTTGQKIYDFIDSAIGKATRTFYGDDPRAGAPAVADVHSLRDTGTVDPALHGWVEKTFGKSLADKLKLDPDTSPGEAKYEWAADRMREWTAQLNRQNWQGRSDWTPAEVQAVGWMTMSKMLGRAGQTAEEAIAANIRNLSYELDFGAGAPWNRTFPEWGQLPIEDRARISQRILDRIMDFAVRVTGAQEFARIAGTGGWEEATNPAFRSRFIASPEVTSDVANIAGYLGQQTAVYESRWVNNGGKLGLAIHGEGLDSNAAIRMLWAEIIQNHPDLAVGFSPTRDAAGRPGMEMTFAGGGARLAERVRTELMPTIDAAAKRLGIDTDTELFKAESKLHTNDWERNPDGREYLQRLGERYGPEIQGRLDDFNRGELEPALRQEIADAAPTEPGAAAGEPGIAAAEPGAGPGPRGPPRELEQARRGSIRLADLVKNTRAVITLFKDADASTFIHELGHAWLEELIRFAAEDGAPARMVDDLATVRRWVGAKEGETFTTRQHEQFARGFERYVMEGVAPSRELAGVFAKFKDWLTRIYQTVDRLRAPINDEIRGVYARMLAVEPEAVIAAEREPAPGFAATHEADATATGAGQAHSVADQIRGERDAIAGERASPELDAERRAERGAAENAGDAARGGVPDGGGDAGQPGPQGPGVDTGAGAVGAGGTEAAPQGARSRGTGTEQPRTPNAPFPRGDSAHIDKAGNIRLDNLGTPEDVNAVIREAAAQGNEFVAARRGVIPDSEVASLADALGMDAKQLDKRNLGEAFNAEQVLAARKLLVQSATNVRDLAGRVEGGTDADLMAYAQARARHMMIQEQVAGITAEAGRALRAFRAIEGAADAREIGLVLREETGRTLNQLRQEARTLSQLTTPQQVSKVVADLRKPTWKDMAVEAWINALLSGPATHIANMVGNASVAVNSILETALAAGIGTARGALGGAAERVYMGEVAARVFGLVKGSQEGVIAAGKALLDENAVSQSAHTLEQRRFQAIPSVKVNVGGIEMNLGGAQIRLPGRLLTAEDELFKAIAFRQELNALAYRQAATEGLTGDALHARVADLIENPPDPMVEAAKSNEAYQTFTNPLGPTGRAAQMAINSSIFAKVIVPFMRTPVNLFKYAAERTPFGLLSSEVRDNLIGRNGAVARDTQIARLALGSAIAVSIAGLASSSDAFPAITGAGPSDPQENAKLRQTGWQPYSMKIGNFYYSYAWMDPLATIMGITADMTDAVKAGRADDANLGKITSMLVSNLAKNIMGKLSLRGTSDLIQALTDPDRYGSKWLQGITGSIVPSAVALSARINDPVLREARSEWDALKARIPGLRQDLMPKIDVWGQPVPNQGALGPDVLSRIYMSKITDDPVNLELQRLGKMPAAVGRKIVGVELTDRQHEDYARTAGTMTKMQLDRLVASPGFAQWPDFAKREAITKLVDGTREQAQELMKVRYPVIWRTALAAKKAEVHGATPEHIKSMLRTPAEAAPAGAGR